MNAPADPKLNTSFIRPQTKRRFWLLFSFFIFVIAPFSFVTYYYVYLATDRYASTAGFSVRSIQTNSGLDGVSALTGLASSGSTKADSYIVLKFLESRALVESLDEKTGLRAMYTDEKIDWLSRLAADTSIEEFTKYWQSRIHSEFDPSSGIIEFTVQSFSPEHTRILAEEIIRETQRLVNELSAAAREDSLRFAEQEVVLQEERLRRALEAIRSFRQQEQSVDPNATATLDAQLLGDLEARLVDIKARIAVQSDTLNSDAPSLVMLKREAAALNQQIEIRRAELSGNLSLSGDPEKRSVTAQLTTFESLEIERRFAEEAYASTLDSLEQTRRDADRQQRYLAVHLHPRSAEISEYPRRIRNILLAAFVLFCIWTIGTLICYSIRDHLT